MTGFFTYTFKRSQLPHNYASSTPARKAKLENNGHGVPICQGLLKRGVTWHAWPGARIGPRWARLPQVFEQSVCGPGVDVDAGDFKAAVSQLLFNQAYRASVVKGVRRGSVSEPMR